MLSFLVTDFAPFDYRPIFILLSFFKSTFRPPSTCERVIMSIFISTASFEYHTEALGIPESSPRISWKFKGDVQNWIQETYEVEIQHEAESSAETYLLHTSESCLVPWPSKPLLSGGSATVRVRSSGKGVNTPWSKSHKVEAGLLDSSDWLCELIESPREIGSSHAEAPTLFRRHFQVTKPVLKARLYITVHGVYESEINGARVGDHVLAPGWTVYDKELSYQTFDVTGHLRLENGGQNTIGVSVAEGWYAGRLGFHGGRHNIVRTRFDFVSSDLKKRLLFSYAAFASCNCYNYWGNHKILC